MKLFQKLINLLKLSKLMQTKSHLNGKTINLTSDNTVIKSTNFNVDKNGKMTCSNAQITGGKIKVNGTGTATDLIRVENSNDTSEFSYIMPVGAGFVGSQGRIDIAAEGNNADYSFILLDGTGGNTSVKNTGISTPTLTQTSKEEMKKNFEPLNNALEIVKKTDIYKYNLKSEEDGSKKHIGFVIGDKYNYAEELTSINNDGADIYSLASVCLQAIKEQQEEIELLKQEIIKLKGEQ